MIARLEPARGFAYSFGMRAWARAGPLLLLVLAMTACTLPSRFAAMQREMHALAAAPLAPQPPGPPRYRGVIHVHSELSHDSRGSAGDLLRAAKTAGLDFVMTTDHNGPAIFERGVDGLVDGILFIRGAEIRVDGEYLLALGIDSFLNPGGLRFDQAAAAVIAKGGVPIGAHPARFAHWDAPNLAGVEVWDLYDEANSDRWRYAGKALDILFWYGRYPEALIGSIVRHPTRALARFDAETGRRRLTAIATPDAHRNIRVLGRQLDPYPLTFRLPVTYVLADEKSRPALLEALRRGRTYFAFEVFAPAPHFDFRLVDDRGTFWIMGDEPPAAPGQSLHVVSPHRGRITIVRDGKVFRRADGSELTVAIDGPGVYRSEVALSVQGRWRPWIYSNPIYVR